VAWCKLEDTLPDHWKVARLASSCGIDEVTAIGHIVCLWCWCLRFRPDGDLKNLTPTEIARAARLPVDSVGAEDFFHALVDAQLIDEDPNEKNVSVHEWMDRAQGYHEARRASRYRRKNKRDHHVTVTDASREHNGSVTLERRGEESRVEESRSEELNTLPANSLRSSAGAGKKRERKPVDPTLGTQLRREYERLWEARMGQPYTAWSARHAQNAAKIANSPNALAEALVLLGDFVNSTHPQIVAGGFSFCIGAWSFATQLDALRARRAQPNLQRAYRALEATERQTGNEDAEKVKFEQDMARLRRQRAQQERSIPQGGSESKPAVGALNAFSGGVS